MFTNLIMDLLSNTEKQIFWLLLPESILAAMLSVMGGLCPLDRESKQILFFCKNGRHCILSWCPSIIAFPAVLCQLTLLLLLLMPGFVKWYVCGSSKE